MGLICTGLKNGLYVFLLRQYFLGMPKELEEAAYVDGAGKIKVFLKIAMPMAIPAVVVSLIFSLCVELERDVQHLAVQQGYPDSPHAAEYLC